MQAHDLKAALLGAWVLSRWEIAYSDRRPPSNPFGLQTTGMLLYTPDGHMSAGIARHGRARFDSPSARHATADQKCAAFDSYFHYQGRYRVEDDQVIHEVHQSLNPNFPGTLQIRRATLSPDRLELSADDLLPGTSVSRTHRLLWQRPGT